MNKEERQLNNQKKSERKQQTKTKNERPESKRKSERKTDDVKDINRKIEKRKWKGKKKKEKRWKQKQKQDRQRNKEKYNKINKKTKRGTMICRIYCLFGGEGGGLFQRHCCLDTLGGRSGGLQDAAVEHLQPECLISLPYINHMRKNKILPYLLT